MSEIPREVQDYYGADTNRQTDPEDFRRLALTATDRAYAEFLTSGSAIARVDGINQSGAALFDPVVAVLPQTRVQHVRNEVTPVPIQRTESERAVPVQARLYKGSSFTVPIPDLEVAFLQEDKFATYGISGASVYRRVNDREDAMALQEYHNSLVEHTGDKKVMVDPLELRLPGAEAHRRRAFMLTRRSIQDSLLGPRATVTEEGEVVAIESSRPTVNAAMAARALDTVLTGLGIKGELEPTIPPSQIAARASV